MILISMMKKKAHFRSSMTWGFILPSDTVLTWLF